MEIIVEIHKGEDGRPAGTVRSARPRRKGGLSPGTSSSWRWWKTSTWPNDSTTPSVPDDEAGLTDDNTERREQ